MKDAGEAEGTRRAGPTPAPAEPKLSRQERSAGVRTEPEEPAVKDLRTEAEKETLSQPWAFPTPEPLPGCSWGHTSSRACGAPAWEP